MRPSHTPDSDDMARAARSRPDTAGPSADFIGQTLRAFGLPWLWPYGMLEAVAELLHNSSDPVYRGDDVRFGDGKPIVLVPGHLGSDVTLEPLSIWLHAIGYRPVKSNILININDRSLDEPIAVALRTATRRIGRKAVMIALDTGCRAALRVAEIEHAFVSDVIALGLSDEMPLAPAGVRLHVIDNNWRKPAVKGPNVHLVPGTRPLLSINPATLRIISAILRDIPIELLSEQSPDMTRQAPTRDS
jgi:hypothetical protein